MKTEIAVPDAALELRVAESREAEVGNRRPAVFVGVDTGHRRLRNVVRGDLQEEIYVRMRVLVFEREHAETLAAQGVAARVAAVVQRSADGRGAVIGLGSSGRKHDRAVPDPRRREHEIRIAVLVRVGLPVAQPDRFLGIVPLAAAELRNLDIVDYDIRP